MSFKKLIWKITPNAVHGLLREVYFILQLIPATWYDYLRFLRYSGLNKSHRYRNVQAARITMTYHQIEKGLSLATPRPGFGKEVIDRLFTALEPFIVRFGLVPPATTAISALNAYVRFNEGAGLDMSEIRKRLLTLAPAEILACGYNETAGSISITRRELDRLRCSNFQDVFNSRYSIRNFAGGPIERIAISDAVRLAQKTPSVCNRQAWKVHVFDELAAMKRLLAIQAGNRGFGENASAVLVVTCDLQCFVEVAERYQAWIDGGMFCMSLCLAFHAAGYGTCCLNWSKEPADDRRLRAAAPIADAEQVIMLIAIGTLPEQLNVAASPRRPLEDALAFH